MLLVVLVSGVALANIFNTVANFFGGIYVGPRSTATTANRITKALTGSIPFTNGDGGQLFTGCAEATGTVTGALPGDVCGVSFPIGTGGTFVDGGTGQVAVCTVSAADTVTVRACPVAGQLQLIPRAAFPFVVRVISSQ
jgi:hypothetical protein